jgi:hypothetical protein
MNTSTISYPLIIRKNSAIEGSYMKKVTHRGFTTKEGSIFMQQKQHLDLTIPRAIKTKKNGFISEILFHGFNFTAKRVKLYRPKYYVDSHKSEMFFCLESITNTYKSKVYKRRLVFFSYDKTILHLIQKLIKQFKIPDSYTGKGLFERNDSYTIKKRKKRK